MAELLQNFSPQRLSSLACSYNNGEIRSEGRNTVSEEKNDVKEKTVIIGEEGWSPCGQRSFMMHDILEEIILLDTD